jgi:DNA replication initiation complex subunit (GINS family)
VEFWGVCMTNSGSDIAYEGLWQAAYKEKKTNELQILPKTFYSDMISYINSLKDDEETREVKSNAFKLLEDLFDRRKQKILIYIAHNKPLPQPIIEAEQDFYDTVLNIYKSKNLDHGIMPKVVNEETLSVVKDIPEIMLPSGTKIGPLKKGDRVPVSDTEDIEFLKSASICAPE